MRLFLALITIVSLIINNVNMVGVVLISIARQAQRVNVHVTMNTQTDSILRRFLVRTMLIYLINNTLKVALSLLVTFALRLFLPN